LGELALPPERAQLRADDSPAPQRGGLAEERLRVFEVALDESGEGPVLDD
jgi:hypothetical protein